MSDERIFIVEDEKIVAEDLKQMLQRLGYNVVGDAPSGEKAIERIEKEMPQLVLMDIRLQGSMDGVDVAEHVYAQYDIPVIYLTAYADDLTVDRAKGTLASGYILKPFEERSLKTTIELALYRHKMENMFKNAEEWHGSILENLSEPVVATDINGNITYMNKSAENLTGHELDKVIGKSFKTEFLSKNIKFKESPVLDNEGNLKGTAFVLIK